MKLLTWLRDDHTEQREQARRRAEEARRRRERLEQCDAAQCGEVLLRTLDLQLGSDHEGR